MKKLRNTIIQPVCALCDCAANKMDTNLADSAPPDVINIPYSYCALC